MAFVWLNLTLFHCRRESQKDTRSTDYAVAKSGVNRTETDAKSRTISHYTAIITSRLTKLTIDSSKDLGLETDVCDVKLQPSLRIVTESYRQAVGSSRILGWAQSHLAVASLRLQLAFGRN